MAELLAATRETPEFSLCGQSIWGKVVELYDADTCKIVIPLNGTLYKFIVRLAGIDTPEMRPRKEKPNRDAEIAWAKRARAELLQMICPGNTVVADVGISKDRILQELERNRNLVLVRCKEFDKYGRLLGELYADEEGTLSFNQRLIDKGVAVSYDGGTKVAPWISAGGAVN
jgi:endonuclease YncB( thermonuclease family)